VVAIAQLSTLEENTATSTNPTTAMILICALKNGALKLYDRSTLQHISTMQGAADVVQVCLSSTSSPCVVLAASRNGTVTAFDIRQRNQLNGFGEKNNPSSAINSRILQQRITYTETIHSMDFCSETSTIALGGSNGIFLWDWRYHPKHNVALFSDTHQNVTQVRFLQRNRLVSAGDSLLCVLDCTNACETALCIMYTGTTTTTAGTSAPVCKKLGFCGNEGTIAYCISTDNTISLWDLAKGQRLHETGIHNLRQKSRSTNLTMNTIVDCSFDQQNQSLSLLASNYSGDAMIFSLQQNSTPTGGQHHNHQWQATQRLVGGHRGMVTAWSGSLTGGSDARVCEWMPSSTVLHSVAASDDTTVAGSIRSFQPTKRQRFDAE
jgi:WD40 repeat protein